MKTHRLAGTCYDYSHDAYLAALGCEFPDITAAFYDGDFTKSLEQAQADKHAWVLDGIRFEPGHVVLDVGCGWGPMLNAIRKRGGHGIGLSISEKQVQYCQDRGLEALFGDWQDTDMSQFPAFDGVVSIGAFEHFCSPEDYEQERQEQIYGQFFEFCHRCLKDGGKLFLQTMTWGYKVPDPSEVDAEAPEDTRLHDRIRGVILGMSSWWPPDSEAQVRAIAEPYFTLLDSNCGRRDYAQTFAEWERRWNALPTLRKAVLLLKQELSYSRDPDFCRSHTHVRTAVERNFFREAFAQSVLSHSRLFFEKKSKAQ